MSSSSGHPDVEALYLKHNDAMYRVAYRVLRESGRKDLAKDTVQLVFESLLKSPPSEPVDNWEAFLVRSVSNKALDLLRSATVRRTDAKPVEEHDRPTGQDVAAEVAGRVDLSRLAAKVREKMALLPEQEKYVLEECAAKGRPGTEVAAELGVTKGRVSQLKTKALKTVRQMLDEEGVTQ
jgi:RNA polymerase sigma factor (sigma-70 family)